MISSVVPRPIALCSTISGDGQTFNLAPYSYFGAVSHDPPCVVVSICRSGARGGGKKDTLVNAEATGELCINIMSEWYVESANHCCGNYDPGACTHARERGARWTWRWCREAPHAALLPLPAVPVPLTVVGSAPGVDEFELSGLSKAPSKLIKAPRVAEAAVSLECKVRNLQEIDNAQGKVTTTIVLAEVIMFHLHEGVYTPPPEGGKATVDCEKLQPISRLGGNTYGTSLTNFDLPRPDRAWQQKKEETDGGKDKA